MEAELAHILHQTEESYKAVHPGQEERKSGWEKWYAQWLLSFFDLEEIFSYLPSREELEFSLLQGELAFTMQHEIKSWSDFVAEVLYEQLKKSPSGSKK